MLLVRYKYLPGRANSGFQADHYILALGQDAQGRIIYHDSAWYGQAGAYRTMSREQLLRTWANTSVGINYTAMALRPVPNDQSRRQE